VEAYKLANPVPVIVDEPVVASENVATADSIVDAPSA
jgi:hypothetical protein